MNKYYINDNYVPGIAGQLMPDESMIWEGKPKSKAFVINSGMTMMPFALIWLLFDGAFIGFFFGMGGADAMGAFALILIPFFLLHLAPVWIWLYNLLTAKKRWENTEYAVTDKRILLRNGLVGYQYQSIYYTDIRDVTLHVGIIDKMMGVGDITLHSGSDGKSSAQLLDIEQPDRLFSILQKTVLDIQSDIHYPNALRPDNNPGYNTKYTP